MTNNSMDTEQSNMLEEKPPEGVLTGGTVPRENEEDEINELYHKKKENLVNLLDKKAFGEKETQKIDKKIKKLEDD